MHIVSMAEHRALIGIAWLLVLAVIVIALARITDPNWPLAVAAALFSVIVFLGEIVDNLTIVQPRYVIAPALLLYTMIVALLRPRGVMRASAADDDAAGTAGRPVRAAEGGGKWSVRARSAWLPITTFAALLAVVCALNFRVTNGRSESPAWSTVVANAQASCQMPGVTSYLYLHVWWAVRIPCSRLPSSAGR